MKKSIHTKLKRSIIAGAIPPLAIVLLSPAIFCLVAYAEVDPSTTYSAPLSPNVTDYNIDGDVTLDVNVAEINALEITLSTSNLVIDLTPHIGVSSFDTDTLNILVGTTNITGYTLTMASSYGGSNTTSLTRTESINNTVPTIDTIASITTSSNFSSPSDASSINKWGYMLTTTGLDVDKTVYNPVLTSNTINSSTEAIYNDPTSITFGAKVDSTIPAGDYKAVLKFMAVGNYVPQYNIYWDYNNSRNDTIVATTVVEQHNLALPIEPHLPDNTYYTAFVGWNTEPDGSGDVVTSATIPTSDSIYYAIWKFAPNTLQATTASTCSGAKYDARDGNAYMVGILGDGRCWLLDNLAVENLTVRGGDTNNKAAFTIPNSSNDWLVNGSTNMYKQAWINSEYKNETSSYGSGNGALGVYYNFCSVSAGTYCSFNPLYDTDIAVGNDLCPRGWRLPTDGENGEWYRLWASYDSVANFRNALRAPLGNKWLGSSFGSGTASFYWSSVAGGHYAFAPIWDGAVMNISNKDLRAYGLTVRCILNN